MNKGIENGWYVPSWADPEKRKQKELRQDASGLSFALLMAQPVSAVLTIIAVFVLVLCGANVLAPGTESVGGLPPTAYYFLSAMASVVSVVGPFWILLILRKKRLADTILVEKTGVLNGLLIAVSGLFLSIVMNIPANLLTELLERFGLNGDVNTAAMQVYSLPDVLGLLLGVVIVAPLAEEFAFRGVLVSVMRRWGDWFAVAFSTVVFAMAHMSVQALPVVVVGGFVMALIYVRTRNIWINILIHFLNNLFATLPIVLSFFFGEQVAAQADSLSFLLICIAGVVSIGVLLLRRRLGHPVFKTKMERGEPVRGKVRQMILNPGFIVYTVFFLAMTTWLTVYV